VSAFSRSVFAVVAGLAVVATLVLAPASLARSTQRVHTLTVTAASTDTEHGGGDTGPAGLSKGDTYVSNAKIRNRAGRVVGTYHVACVITDENDNRGNAWSICWTVARITGHGTLIATGLAELLHVKTAPGGFGVAPPKATFAIVGGTGSYADAHGQVTSKRTASTRTLRYRFRL
jgi:hypothetical protein